VKYVIKDLRKLSDNELQKRLESTQQSLLKLRFQKVVDEVTDISQIRKLRRGVRIQ
jgi:ribosomal protein L29